jgi:hypothetical protein
MHRVHRRTIVDKSRDWLELHAKEQPALAAARAVVMWHRAWARRVDELRRSTAIRDHAALSLVHRTGVELVRAITTKHSTFSVFMSGAPLDGLRRWQKWMILITLILEQLLVNIWCARAVVCVSAGRPAHIL